MSGVLKLEAAEALTAEFPLPAELVGKSSIAIRLPIDQIFRTPGDPRKLGLSVTTIEII